MKRRKFLSLLPTGLALADASAQSSVRNSFEGSIAGRVVDAQGRLAPVSLFIAPPDFQSRKSVLEKPSGISEQFVLKHLPFEHCIVFVKLLSPSVEEEWYFYPGTPDRDKATILNLSRGRRFDLGEFRLPHKVKVQMINGYVTWPDGSRALGAEVSYMSDSEPVYNRYPDTAVKYLGRGRFAIYGYKDTAYWIGARKGNARTKGTRLVVDADINSIELILAVTS